MVILKLESQGKCHVRGWYKEMIWGEQRNIQDRAAYRRYPFERPSDLQKGEHTSQQVNVDHDEIRIKFN